MSPISGGDSGGVPPLPIPNREVKPACADGTAMQCGRVGNRLFSLKQMSSESSGREILRRTFLLFFLAGIIFLEFLVFLVLSRISRISSTSSSSITSRTSSSSSFIKNPLLHLGSEVEKGIFIANVNVFQAIFFIVRELCLIGVL